MSTHFRACRAMATAMGGATMAAQDGRGERAMKVSMATPIQRSAGNLSRSFLALALGLSIIGWANGAMSREVVYHSDAGADCPEQVVGMSSTLVEGSYACTTPASLVIGEGAPETLATWYRSAYASDTKIWLKEAFVDVDATIPGT